MADPKHTPGPWTVIENSSGKHLVCADHPQAAHFDIALTSGPDSVANARLIAAAPELLEACQRYIAEREEIGLSCDSAAVRGIRAAIAKATGSAS